MYGAPFWLERGQNGPVVSLCGGGRGACRSAYLVVSKPVICVGMMHTTNGKVEDVLFLAAGGATYLAIPNHLVGAGSFRAEGACGCGGGVGVGVVGVIGGHGGYGGPSWLLACVFFFYIISYM